ncbi:MAG: response regulator transcription factor [Methylococcaceae bacterium]|nr:response regulator transcription factor [Methylococcaceae bacterium]
MISSKAITIMLVDDHAIVREGYRSLLQKQKNMDVIAEASNGEDAYILFKQYQPDVIIMDLSLPGRGGIETISRLCKLPSKPRILVFSMHQNPTFALQASKAGALGYVTKSNQPDVLVRAIYEVHEGRIFISADIAQALALEKLTDNIQVLKELTVREFEILRMLVEGISTEKISQLLNISPKTVSNCHYLIKRKLSVASDIELIHLAIKMNILNLDYDLKK